MRAADQEAATLDEPRFASALREVLARAARRPLRTAGVAALVAAIVVTVRVMVQPLYVATLTFRMEEGDVQAPEDAPPPPAHIREHLSNVALNRQRLLSLMEKHGVFRQLRRLDPEAALSSIREDIDIDVIRNYFLFDRETAGGRRSAQVVLSFTSGDRDEAQAIVRDMGAIILENQAAVRTAPLEQAEEISVAQARLARLQLAALEERRASALRRAAAGAAARAGVGAELAAVQHEIDGALMRVQDLERRAAELGLARDAEQQQLGLSLQLVDERVQALREPLDAAGVALRAAFVLLVVAPVVAVLLGAFDDHVYGVTDLISHGFPVLGAVSPFPAEAGAYGARSRARDPQRPSP